MTEGSGREEILRRFETLLDSALSSEAPPAGIDAELLAAVSGDGSAETPATDSYALWSAVTALTQEIRLQGRAFQDLNLTLGAQAEKIAEELRGVCAERERALQRETERRCRRDVLHALIDLRDRLGRGRETVRAREAEALAAPRAGWFARLFAKAPGDAADERLGGLIRGYELSVERLDQTLDEFGAREIRCAGETFDPRRMNAIDSEETSAVRPDTVLEVYRSGYEWNNEIFRTAQVKVSRAPAANGNNE